MEKDIVRWAKALEGQRGKSKCATPYNVFTAWQMSENDHTKMLLALFRYQNAQGRYPLLNSFLNRFAKGRDKMIHYQNPSDVCICFNPRYDKDDKHSYIDGLITFAAKGKRIAVIIENKIFDAPDQDGQIRRYISHMTQDERIEKENVWVFYLTGSGVKDVSENSYNPCDEDDAAYIGRRFVALNYSGDIIQWLKNDVLDLRVYPEALTSVVRSYVESLEKDVLCEDDTDAWRETQLCNTLLGHHNLKKLDERDFDSLYFLRDEVQKIRKEGTCGDEQEMTAVNNLYGVIRSVIRDVELLAFDEFETQTEEILNDIWKRELKQIKGARWVAKHRGLGGNWGFVQVGLTEEWGTAHLEWTSIKAKSMFCETEYQLELHVEGDKNLAEHWRTEFSQNAIMLPKNCEKGRKQTSRIVRYKIQTAKPIATMSKKELTVFLTKLYMQDLNYICRTLIEHFKDYSC